MKKHIQVEKLSGYEIPSKIDEAIAWLQKMKELHGPTTRIEINSVQEQYSVDCFTEILISREETDKEYELRKQVDQARNDRIKKSQYEEYLRLKKQFENE